MPDTAQSIEPYNLVLFYFNEAITTHCDPASQFKVEEQQYHDFFLLAQFHRRCIFTY